MQSTINSGEIALILIHFSFFVCVNVISLRYLLNELQILKNLPAKTTFHSYTSLRRIKEIRRIILSSKEERRKSFGTDKEVKLELNVFWLLYMREKFSPRLIFYRMKTHIY
jgi:hypothetical protein